MGSSCNNRGNRLSWAVGVSLAFATGIPLSVLADSPTVVSSTKPFSSSQADVTKSSGIMTFEHVRVVNAPITHANTRDGAAAQGQALAQNNSAGMRAYVDPQTKRLREQSPDEARQVASESRVRLKSQRAPMARSSASFVESSDGAQIIYGADGSEGILLDEDTMVYQLGHKEANGAIGQQCVQGEAHVLKALHSDATHTVQVEVRHDR